MTSRQTENNEFMSNGDERRTVIRTTCCPFTDIVSFASFVKIGLLNKKQKNEVLVKTPRSMLVNHRQIKMKMQPR